MNTVHYEKDNISYWANRSAGYSVVNQEELATSQHERWGTLLDEKIRSHFPGSAPADLHVLDIGTGPGFFSIILAERGYHVSAVDYTPEMLDQARRNAGMLGSKIRYQLMNAEDLTFEDNTFDVIISRNLTWNLPHPDQAYRHWTRVLKKGGLFLNFDANWYRYLFDEEAKDAHLEDRERIKQKGADDENAAEGSNVPAMESIARRAPLSKVLRPSWDLQVLSSFGMHAQADEQIWERVWTQNEYINNASTPMFLVQAVKQSS